MKITEFLEARIAEDEERIAAECAAKRELIPILEYAEEIYDGKAFRSPLEILAAVYKDHPDYRQEWA